jgi:hypothetical protein
MNKLIVSFDYLYISSILQRPHFEIHVHHMSSYIVHFERITKIIVSCKMLVFSRDVALIHQTDSAFSCNFVVINASDRSLCFHICKFFNLSTVTKTKTYSTITNQCRANATVYSRIQTKEKKTDWMRRQIADSK